MSTTTTTETMPAQETERPFPHTFNSGDILYADDLNIMTSAIVSALNVTTTIGTVFSYIGSVSTEDDLPENAANGDVYNVEDTGMNYVYTDTGWDPLGASLENYATKTDISNINTNITTLTNAVNSKASQTDLTTVSVNTNTNTTNIASLTTSVNEKANQTDLDELSDTVEKMITFVKWTE